MFRFLRAYLAWSIETYVSKLSNIKISFYCNIVCKIIQCVKALTRPCFIPSAYYRRLFSLSLKFVSAFTFLLTFFVQPINTERNIRPDVVPLPLTLEPEPVVGSDLNVEVPKKESININPSQSNNNVAEAPRSKPVVSPKVCCTYSAYFAV